MVLVEHGRASGWIRRVFMGLWAVLLVLLTGCWSPDPGIVLPAAPTGLAASEGGYADRVSLSWSPVQGAESYRVHRAAVQDGPYALAGITGGTSHQDTQVDPGALYWYCVQACGNGGCGRHSTAVVGYAHVEEPSVPALPEAFAASQGAYDGKISVTWPTVSQAVAYELYRADDVTGPFDLIAVLADSHHDDVDRSGNRLIRCHGYWYRMAVCTVEGCGPLSHGVEGWRGTRIEGVVTGLVASDYVYPDRVRLTWDPLPGAKSYTIYRGHKDHAIGTSTTARYDDVHEPGTNPLEARRDYTYWVRAEGYPDGACEPSGLSASVRGRATPVPGTPVDLASSAQVNQVTVHWRKGSAILEPTEYTIYRASSHGGPYAPHAEVAHPSLTYTDTDVAPGGTYWYRVTASNLWGTGEPSDPVGAQVP